jgi:hypothetical protein
MMNQLNKTQLELAEWLDNQLRYNNVPRLVDVQIYVKRQGLALTKKQVAQVVRLHAIYKMNMPQQRNPGKSKMYRPVVVSELGHWHADIGFFAVNARYETPITYRAGYLVAKDILSRRVYATPLLKNRQADSMMRLIRKHPSCLKKYKLFLLNEVLHFMPLKCHHLKQSLQRVLLDKLEKV